jgi:hypothetical protein
VFTCKRPPHVREELYTFSDDDDADDDDDDDDDDAVEEKGIRNSFQLNLVIESFSSSNNSRDNFEHPKPPNSLSASSSPTSTSKAHLDDAKHLVHSQLNRYPSSNSCLRNFVGFLMSMYAIVTFDTQQVEQFHTYTVLLGGE